MAGEFDPDAIRKELEKMFPEADPETVNEYAAAVLAVSDASENAEKTGKRFTDMVEHQTGVLKLAGQRMHEGAAAADDFAGGLGKTATGLTAAGIAAAFVLSKFEKFFDGVKSSLKDLKTYRVEMAKASKTTLIAPGGPAQLAQFRRELRMTRKEFRDFSKVLIEGTDKGVANVNELVFVAKKLRATFGGDQTENLKEYVGLLEKIPTLSTDLTLNASVDDQAAAFFALAKEGKIQTVIELQQAGLFGGVGVGVPGMERDVEILNSMQAAEATQERIEDVILNTLPSWSPHVAGIASGVGKLAGMAGALLGVVSGTGLLLGRTFRRSNKRVETAVDRVRHSVDRLTDTNKRLAYMRTAVGGAGRAGGEVARAVTTGAVVRGVVTALQARGVATGMRAAIGGAGRVGANVIPTTARVVAIGGRVAQSGVAAARGLPGALALPAGKAGSMVAGALPAKATAGGLVKSFVPALKSAFTRSGPKMATTIGTKVAFFAGPAIATAGVGLLGAISESIGEKLVKSGKEVSGGFLQASGALAEFTAALTSGAAVGTMILPGIGTLIGTVLGGAVAASIGSFRGIEKGAMSLARGLNQTTKVFGKDVPMYSSAWREIGKEITGVADGARKVADVFREAGKQVAWATGWVVSWGESLIQNIVLSGNYFKNRKQEILQNIQLTQSQIELQNITMKLGIAEKRRQRLVQQSALALRRLVSGIENASKTIKVQFADLQAEVAGLSLENLSQLGGTTKGFQLALDRASVGVADKFMILTKGLETWRKELMTDVTLTPAMRLTGLELLHKAELKAANEFGKAMAELVGQFDKIPSVVLAELQNKVRQTDLELAVDAGAVSAEQIFKNLDQQLESAFGAFVDTTSAAAMDYARIQKNLSTVGKTNVATAKSVAKSVDRWTVEGGQRAKDFKKEFDALVKIEGQVVHIDWDGLEKLRTDTSEQIKNVKAELDELGSKLSITNELSKYLDAVQEQKTQAALVEKEWNSFAKQMKAAAREASYTKREADKTLDEVTGSVLEAILESQKEFGKQFTGKLNREINGIRTTFITLGGDVDKIDFSKKKYRAFADRILDTYTLVNQQTGEGVDLLGTRLSMLKKYDKLNQKALSANARLNGIRAKLVDLNVKREKITKDLASSETRAGLELKSVLADLDKAAQTGTDAFKRSVNDLKNRIEAVGGVGKISVVRNKKIFVDALKLARTTVVSEEKLYTEKEKEFAALARREAILASMNRLQEVAVLEAKMAANITESLAKGMKDFTGKIAAVADSIGKSKAAQAAQRQADILTARADAYAFIGRGEEQINAELKNSSARLEAGLDEIVRGEVLLKKWQEKLANTKEATAAVAKGTRASIDELGKVININKEGLIKKIGKEAADALGNAFIELQKKSVEFAKLSAKNIAGEKLEGEDVGKFQDLPGEMEKARKGIADTVSKIADDDIRKRLEKSLAPLGKIGDIAGKIETARGEVEKAIDVVTKAEGEVSRAIVDTFENIDKQADVLRKGLDVAAPTAIADTSTLLAELAGSALDFNESGVQTIKAIRNTSRAYDTLRSKLEESLGKVPDEIEKQISMLEGARRISPLEAKRLREDAKAAADAKKIAKLAEIEKERKEKVVQLADSEVQRRMTLIDAEQATIDEQVDFLTEIGGNYERILQLQADSAGKEIERLRALKVGLEAMEAAFEKTDPADRAAFAEKMELQRLEIVKQEFKVQKRFLGVQRSAFEQLAGMAFGQIRESVGVRGGRTQASRFLGVNVVYDKSGRPIPRTQGQSKKLDVKASQKGISYGVGQTALMPGGGLGQRRTRLEALKSGDAIEGLSDRLKALNKAGQQAAIAGRQLEGARQGEAAGAGKAKAAIDERVTVLNGEKAAVDAVNESVKKRIEVLRGEIGRAAEATGAKAAPAAKTAEKAAEATAERTVKAEARGKAKAAAVAERSAERQAEKAEVKKVDRAASGAAKAAATLRAPVRKTGKGFVVAADEEGNVRKLTLDDLRRKRAEARAASKARVAAVLKKGAGRPKASVTVTDEEGNVRTVTLDDIRRKQAQAKAAARKRMAGAGIGGPAKAAPVAGAAKALDKTANTTEEQKKIAMKDRADREAEMRKEVGRPFARRVVRGGVRPARKDEGIVGGAAIVGGEPGGGAAVAAAPMPPKAEKRADRGPGANVADVTGGMAAGAVAGGIGRAEAPVMPMTAPGAQGTAGIGGGGEQQITVSGRGEVSGQATILVEFDNEMFRSKVSDVLLNGNWFISEVAARLDRRYVQSPGVTSNVFGAST